MYKFVKSPGTRYGYECNCGTLKFQINDHVISGVVKLYWDNSSYKKFAILLDTESFILLNKEINSFSKCRKMMDEYAQYFNDQINHQLENMYGPGGEKYLKSEEKIQQLENQIL